MRDYDNVSHVSLMMRKAAMQIREACKRNPICEACPFRDENGECKLTGRRPEEWRT